MSYLDFELHSKHRDMSLMIDWADKRKSSMSDYSSSSESSGSSEDFKLSEDQQRLYQGSRAVPSPRRRKASSIHETREPPIALVTQPSTIFENERQEPNREPSVISMIQPTTLPSILSIKASILRETPTQLTNVSNPDIMLMEAYLKHEPSLHIQRTLDQFYYFMLENTEERDKDQVVYRWAQTKNHDKDPMIIMASQMWIWLIEDG